jgi:hypothetical protein
MPKKGVVEKTEDTMGDFLWMPDVVAPLYDILKSLSQTAKFIGSVLVGGFTVFIYISMVMDLKKTPYPWTISLVAPLVIIFVGASVLLLIVIAIGFVFSPLTLFGYPILTSYPYTCPPTHPELNGLLCYKPCPSGRHRVSDVCWADTQENGVGTPIGLEPCPDGWNNWGLVCQNPIHCDPIDTSHFPWTGGGCHGGELVGRLDHGGVCPGPEDAGGLPGFDDWYKRWKAASAKKARTKKKCSEPATAHDGERSCEEQTLVEKAVHTERIDGLCYKPCPSGMTHVPGMPYLCVKQESDGKPMRLDYYDSDSKVPTLVQLFGRFNPF